MGAKIKEDSAFLDQNPITIGDKQDTVWSASDGAFYYYSGTVQKNGTIGSLTDKGIVISGYSYARTS